MIRTLKAIKIQYRKNAPSDYMPKNMLLGKTYPVVAEQSRIRTTSGRDVRQIEEILLGFIGEDQHLTFVASYNCYVGIDEEEEVLPIIKDQNGEKPDSKKEKEKKDAVKDDEKKKKGSKGSGKKK